MIGRMRHVVLDCPDPPALATAHFRDPLPKPGFGLKLRHVSLNKMMISQRDASLT
jgi:hypothetical protein